MTDSNASQNIIANIKSMSKRVMNKLPSWQVARNQGVLLGERGQFREALRSFDEAVYLFESSTDPMKDLNTNAFVPDVLNQKGCVLFRKGDLEKAIVVFDDALLQASNIANGQEVALQIKFNLAQAHVSSLRNNNDYKTINLIQSYYQDLATAYRSGPYENKAQLGNVLYMHAEFLNNIGSFLQAEGPARECLQVRKELYVGALASPEVCMTLCLLAVIISAPRIGKWDEAEAHALAALDMAQHKPDQNFTLQSTKAEEIHRIQSIIASVQRARRMFAGVLLANRQSQVNHTCGGRQNDEKKQAGYPCGRCGKRPSTLICTGCRSIRYCSRSCQKQDWKPTHKLRCKAIQQGHKLNEPIGDSSTDSEKNQVEPDQR